MERRESEKATEVYVPRTQYPNGFYVWLSDGAAFFDDERQILYWYPTDDAPGVEHALHIEPREDIREVSGWSYFFHDGQVIQGSGAVHPNAEEVAQ